jgi:hypothetical protein
MTLNQSDIDYIVDLLIKTKKSKDLEYLDEAIEYLQEFQDAPTFEDDE